MSQRRTVRKGIAVPGWLRILPAIRRERRRPTTCGLALGAPERAVVQVVSPVRPRRRTSHRRVLASSRKPASTDAARSSSRHLTALASQPATTRISPIRSAASANSPSPRINASTRAGRSECSPKPTMGLAGWCSMPFAGLGAGPSVERLFCGSEGTLGVITEAWIRLQPRPRSRAGASVRFAGFRSAPSFPDS